LTCALVTEIFDRLAKPDSAAVACLDIVEHVPQLVPFGEVAQFHRQILLQRLVAPLGLSLKGSMDVLGEIADQNIRLACILLALGARSIPVRSRV